MAHLTELPATLSELAPIVGSLDVQRLGDATVAVLARRFDGRVGAVLLHDDLSIDMLSIRAPGGGRAPELESLMRRRLASAVAQAMPLQVGVGTLLAAAAEILLHGTHDDTTVVAPLSSRLHWFGGLLVTTSAAEVESTIALLDEVVPIVTVCVDNALLHRDLRAREAALRLSEEILRIRSEADAEGLLVVSPEGAILHHNHRLAELWGLPDDLLARGSDEERLSFQALQVTDPASFIADTIGAYAEPFGPRCGDIALGNGRIFERRGAPLFGDEGTYLGWAWYVRDVSEERQREESLRRSQEKFAALARTLQLSLLPARLPDLMGLDVGAAYHPSGAGEGVGGDFYDVFSITDRTAAVVLGDVCGSDAVAARLTALARYTVKASAAHAGGPDAVLDEVNSALRREAATSSSSDVRFISALVGYVTPDDGGVDVVIASGGHLPPLIVRSDGGVEDPGVRGILLGVSDAPTFTTQRVRLSSGDALVLYTDGVTEARDSARRLFGDERLVVLLNDERGHDAASLAARVMQAALDYQGGVASDDIAVLVIAAPGTETHGPPSFL